MENEFGNTSPAVPTISNGTDTELGTADKVATEAPLFGMAKAIVPSMITTGELLAEALWQFGFTEAAMALRIGIWILRLLTSSVGVKAFDRIVRAARDLGGELARVARGAARAINRLVRTVNHGMRFLGRRCRG
ncbi:hypothetical protein [Nocardia salmonicida]|uniref:hypothetical protein n=1 Tax=Nocardia salmonicida TaxID=53431 RepID=UPI0033D1143F